MQQLMCPTKDGGFLNGETAPFRCSKCRRQYFEGLVVGVDVPGETKLNPSEPLEQDDVEVPPPVEPDPEPELERTLPLPKSKKIK